MDFNMNKIMTVKNRSSSIVVYKIPEHNIRREFSLGEVKKIPYQELVWLTYQPGGRALMENFLQIQDSEAIEELNVHTEPEYFMSEAQIVSLLNEGSMDEFLDALDFAPMGVIDLIKSYAVSLPLNDVKKREALRTKTGFDVTKAIENSVDDEPATAEAPTATRRVKKETPNAPARRTESKYKIVSE